MKLSRLAIPFVAAGVLFTAGCAKNYYASAPPPPPPPSAYAPPMMEHAQHEGFQAGQNDAARDLYDGTGYHPRHNWKYRDTPGYAPGMGPFGTYQNTFRLGYLRGYDAGFRRG